MRRDFLEAVDAGNRKHTGLLVDFKLVAFARLNFFAIEEANAEHLVPPIQRIRANGP